ncbi:MAG: DUF4340 domain-containing protein [Myxococcota bacterium]
MRQIAVLSVALVLSLGWTYTTWFDTSEEPSDEVAVVYDAKESELTKISWDSKDLKVSVERRTDDRGEYLWIESSETKLVHPKKTDPAHPGAEEHAEEKAAEEKAPDADPADPAAAPAEGAPAEAPAAEGPPEVKVSKFMASAQGKELWTSFAPLKALRELDTTGADPATFGFGPDDEKVTVTVVRASGPLELQIGGETYGNKDRYVRVGDKTYLVDDASLRPLQFAATRLIERSLFPLEESAIEGVDVMLPAGATVSYVQQNKDDKTKAFWAKSDVTDKEDETGSTWLGKVFKLKLKDYVDESTVATPLESVLSYVVRGGKGEQWKVELLKTTTGDKTEWYARTAYNRSLVSLTESLARNVVDDVESLTAAP